MSRSMMPILFPMRLKYHVQRTAAHWDRLRHIRCEKCVIVDWTDSFCDEKDGEKRMCLAVEAESQLAYFIDDNHYSFLGCRRIRSQLRRIAAENLE
ncbi:hypothetical protein Ddc_14628 [Ditylenchus destructor]|nr:hypothetical protein Ddc_14628 [Ditylenchus destructor]